MKVPKYLFKIRTCVLQLSFIASACIYLSGLTAASRTKLSSDGRPLLCGKNHGTFYAPSSYYPYHKIIAFLYQLSLFLGGDLSPLYKYEAVFCCKVFNINTLVYGLLVFSQTMRVLVQHKRKFFIKKVLRKCRKSAVFRIVCTRVEVLYL